MLNVHEELNLELLKIFFRQEKFFGTKKTNSVVGVFSSVLKLPVTGGLNCRAISTLNKTNGMANMILTALRKPKVLGLKPATRHMFILFLDICEPILIF